MIGLSKTTNGAPRQTRSPDAVVAAELSVKNLAALTRHYRKPAAQRHAQEFHSRAAVA
jgi:hypothetical protein